MTPFKIAATLTFLLIALSSTLLLAATRDDRFIEISYFSTIAMNLSIIGLFIVLIWTEL